MSGYQGQHRPASPDYGAPLHDVESMMPDFYTRPALYRNDRIADSQSISAVLGAYGNPGAMIRIWRAVPASVTELNLGDWVTTSKPYARREAESIQGESHIISRRVRAGDLWNEGNSVNEWGYWPMCGGCTNTNLDSEACPNYGIDLAGRWLCLECCKACCV